MTRLPTPAGRRVLQYMLEHQGHFTRIDGPDLFGLDREQFRSLMAGLLDRGLIQYVGASALITPLGRDEATGVATKRRKGGINRGELSHFSRLTENDVRAIRQELAKGKTGASIAGRFGVSETTIYRVAKRETWRHVA